MKAFVVIAAVLCTLTVGCREKVAGFGSPPASPVELHLMLILDTLRLLPADSTSADGYVVVTEGGRPTPDLHVNLWLLDSSMGFLEYTDPRLRDTTNAEGRVDFRFISRDDTGRNVVHAWYRVWEDTQSVCVRYADHGLAHLDVAVSTDTLLPVPPEEDSLTVTVSLLDSVGQGIPDILMVLNASGGRLSSYPRTDSAGATTARWWTNNDMPGRYFFIARAGGMTDTAWVVVDSSPNSL
jgi:hypothetical protein